MYGKALANQFPGRAGMAAAVLDQAVDEDHRGPRPRGGHPRPLEQGQAVVSAEAVFSGCHAFTYGHSRGLLHVGDPFVSLRAPRCPCHAYCHCTRFPASITRHGFWGLDVYCARREMSGWSPGFSRLKPGLQRVPLAGGPGRLPAQGSHRSVRGHIRPYGSSSNPFASPTT